MMYIVTKNLGGDTVYGIAETTRNLIREKGLKNKTVATRAGYSEKQFSRIMTGAKPMRSEDILRISQALGVTPNELFGISEQEGG